jgi:hypothetical protein
MDKKPVYQFLHSTYWKKKGNDEDAVVACLKDVDTGKTKLEVITNPKRSIGITRKGLQESTNTKKICEDNNNLDIYTIDNKDLRDELQEKLLGYSGGYTSLKKLINSPYVYGADIDISVLIKQHFLKQSDRTAKSFRVGGLDIETSVLGGREILMITYVSPELKVFTAVLDSFVENVSIDSIKEKFKKELAEFKGKLNKETLKIFDEYASDIMPNINITYHKTEVDVITWIFKMIHADKPDFISIWNMGYDIPYMLDRLRVHNVFPHKIMCHPEVPWQYRICSYKADRNPNVSHFSYKWDVFELSGYSQFYDSMCLFSRIRKHEGVEDSYKLEAIAKKITGAGKMDNDNANHYTMQTEKPGEYVVYNIFDSLLLPLIEKRCKDIESMMMLLEDTSIDSFAQQTTQLKNWFYRYCKDKGKMPASWYGKIEHETDGMLHNTGGNVLAPGLAWRTGVNKIKELLSCSKNILSKLIILACDIDVAFCLKKNIGAL